MFGLVIMVLAVYKAAIMWKENGEFRGLNLIKVLIQDQLLYFFMYGSCFLVFSRLIYSADGDI